jgi:hypothetical protein
MQNRIVLLAAAFIAVFLLGFVPQCGRANRLDSELRQMRDASTGAELRDTAALAYLQASQKNYGLAAETTGLFFNRVHNAVNQAQDAARRKALEELLAPRDRITAALAKGDPAVIADLQGLFIQTRAATRGPGAE